MFEKRRIKQNNSNKKKCLEIENRNSFLTWCILQNKSDLINLKFQQKTISPNKSQMCHTWNKTSITR